MRFVFEVWDLIKKAWHKVVYVPIMRMQLGVHGTHVNIGKGARGTWKNVNVGNYVSICELSFIVNAGKDYNWRLCYVWPECISYYWKSSYRCRWKKNV